MPGTLQVLVYRIHDAAEDNAPAGRLQLLVPLQVQVLKMLVQGPDASCTLIYTHRTCSAELDCDCSAPEYARVDEQQSHARSLVLACLGMCSFKFQLGGQAALVTTSKSQCCIRRSAHTSSLQHLTVCTCSFISFINSVCSFRSRCMAARSRRVERASF